MRPWPWAHLKSFTSRTFRPYLHSEVVKPLKVTAVPKASGVYLRPNIVSRSYQKPHATLPCSTPSGLPKTITPDTLAPEDCRPQSSKLTSNYCNLAGVEKE